MLGYARVSTTDQNLSLQTDALKRVGISAADIYCDKLSGAKHERPGLEECLAALRPGDVLVVWKLDRLGRSLRHLLDVVAALIERKIGFRSLQESIDTTTSGGKLVFHIFAALAEFEKDLIRERTLAGLKAARARGRKGGRPPLLATDIRVLTARAILADRSIQIAEYCEQIGVHRSTLYRRANAGFRANSSNPIPAPSE